MLPCYTTLNSDVKWVFEPERPMGLSSTIYHNGRIRKKFRSRFTVDKLFPGFYDLIIDEVQFGDTGKYICIEDNGLGNKHIRILYVQGNYEFYNNLRVKLKPATGLRPIRSALTLVKLWRSRGRQTVSVQHECNMRPSIERAA